MADKKRRPGRPLKGSGELKVEYLDVRLDALEKQTFKNAADIAGVALSAWVRERLRRVARRELEEAGRKVPFLEATSQS